MAIAVREAVSCWEDCLAEIQETTEKETKRTPLSPLKLGRLYLGAPQPIATFAAVEEANKLHDGFTRFRIKLANYVRDTHPDIQPHFRPEHAVSHC